MTATVSETAWRQRCAGGWPNPPAAEAAPQSPTSPQRLARARARARALGQRTPYDDERGRAAPHRSPARARRAGLRGDRPPVRRQGLQPDLPDARQPPGGGGRRPGRVHHRVQDHRELSRRGEVLDLAAAHRRQPRKNRIKHLARRPTEGVDPEDVSQVRMSVGSAPRRRCRRTSTAPTPRWRRPRSSGSCRRRSRTLHEEQRLLVVLRDVEEMSYQEIGEITGSARRHDKIALAPRAHGDQGMAGQTHAVALTSEPMDHEQAQKHVLRLRRRQPAERQRERGRSASGGVHPVPHRADRLSRDRRLAAAAEAGRAPELSLRHHAADLQALARALLRARAGSCSGGSRSSGSRSATIIAMLVYYIAMMHGSPGGVRPRPDPGLPSGHVAEQDLQVLPLGERGRHQVIGRRAAAFEHPHLAAGLLGAGGDDALEGFGVDVLRA